MYYSTTYLSPMGKITLACDACGKNLVGLWLEGQKYYQGTLKEALIEKDAVPLFDIAKKWLDRYFSGQKPINQPHTQNRINVCHGRAYQKKAQEAGRTKLFFL